MIAEIHPSRTQGDHMWFIPLGLKKTICGPTPLNASKHVPSSLIKTISKLGRCSPTKIPNSLNFRPSKPPCKFQNVSVVFRLVSARGLSARAAFHLVMTPMTLRPCTTCTFRLECLTEILNIQIYDELIINGRGHVPLLVLALAPHLDLEAEEGCSVHDRVRLIQ